MRNIQKVPIFGTALLAFNGRSAQRARMPSAARQNKPPPASKILFIFNSEKTCGRLSFHSVWFFCLPPLGKVSRQFRLVAGRRPAVAAGGGLCPHPLQQAPRAPFHLQHQRALTMFVLSQLQGGCRRVRAQHQLPEEPLMAPSSTQRGRDAHHGPGHHRGSCLPRRLYPGGRAVRDKRQHLQRASHLGETGGEREVLLRAALSRQLPLRF